MRFFRLFFFGLISSLLSAGVALPQPDKFPPIKNTQNPEDIPPTPLESLKKITVPDGFNVTLFAGEPDVQQPIAMCLDDRGRLWVAECYTYSGASGNSAWVKDHKDRVLILEDTDNDGRFDKRTVFGDQFQNLSGIATGFGGVWLLTAPNLVFIPTKDGSDLPAGKPEVVLDGFVVGHIGHNIVNGLTWGPDGWLYGRHGIQDTSHVGVPGTPPKERTKLNCSIWRYHPTKKIFEVVTHGTTNPWGFDYDDHGEMFFTNNVNGHLWHVIPGAHYKRMYGEDFDPHLYELIDQHADHNHWDSNKPWHDSSKNFTKHDHFGGGHSHVGAMFYLGDNWPEKYRNTLFMCNTHGHRVNNDYIERHGCGYIGKHGKDFLFANDPWFRGLDLKYGPDGGVYINDWTDLGECHDHDGIHRTSGRIYKVTYGKTAAPKIKDVSKLSNDELIKLLSHKNDWYVRTARRLLQERVAAGQELANDQIYPLDAMLRGKTLGTNYPVEKRLRALWALYGIGYPNFFFHLSLKKGDQNEHLRAWLVRLLVDDPALIASKNKLVATQNAETLVHFVQMAKTDASGLVRLYLASALQRLPLDKRGPLAEALLQREEDAHDHNQPLMIWYGIEPLVASDAKAAIKLAAISKFPKVRQFIARRLTEELAKKPGPVNELVQLALASDSAAFQLDILHGMNQALQGWYKAAPPKAWHKLQDKLDKTDNKELAKLVQSLSVVFGDGRAIGELKKLALDSNAEGNARRAALKVLIDSKAADLLPLLKQLVTDRATVALAVKGLAAYDDPKIPGLVLQYYHYLAQEDRDLAIATLVSRPSYAAELLKAVAAGKIKPADISAYHARQIVSFGKADLLKQLTTHWGDVRTTPEEKKQLIEQYKKSLSPAKLKTADLSQGRVLFNQHCASCHKLFGQGETIGPDLTGGNRDNLDYLLENIIDPSAVVPVGFRMSILTMKDGRTFTGVVLNKTDQVLTLQTPKEQFKFALKEVDVVLPTAQSLMPDGLFNNLKAGEIVNLIAYLMSREQVPLPPGAGKKE